MCFATVIATVSIVCTLHIHESICEPLLIFLAILCKLLKLLLRYIDSFNTFDSLNNGISKRQGLVRNKILQIFKRILLHSFLKLSIVLELNDLNYSVLVYLKNYLNLYFIYV